MTKTAFITGITGQDGSYLAELLLSKGYEVHGLVRRTSSRNDQRIQHIVKDINFHYGDLADSDAINPIMSQVKPDEVYNLAAQSHVSISFEMPEYTSDITGIGTTRLLESIRKYNPTAKFLQASSSEMFGSAAAPQNEQTPFAPCSPYAVSKVYSYWMCRLYRDSYGIFAVNSMAYNHESPRRGDIFVTRKITMGIASILAKQSNAIVLGNLDAKRDWGFAPEYVGAMWKMLKCETASDYVIGTGETHTVDDFVSEACRYANVDRDTHIKLDKSLLRPKEVWELRASIDKARTVLGWEPKITFADLVKIMVDSDMRKVGLEPIGLGDKIVKSVFGNKFWKGD